MEEEIRYNPEIDRSDLTEFTQSNFEVFYLDLSESFGIRRDKDEKWVAKSRGRLREKIGPVPKYTFVDAIISHDKVTLRYDNTKNPLDEMRKMVTRHLKNLRRDAGSSYEYKRYKEYKKKAKEKYGEDFGKKYLEGGR